MKENISLINIHNIRSGKLAGLIPEFYELKNVIENNNWHNKENIFDHTISVLISLEKILDRLDEKTKKYFNEKLDQNSKKDLLKIAALLHDIAKKETLVTNDDGFTTCANHEDEGSKKAIIILNRFNLSEKEINFIADIIKNHNMLHEILIPSNANFKKDTEELKEKLPYIYPELTLLAFADTVGSYLIKTQPSEFKSRISFYEEEIKKLL